MKNLFQISKNKIIIFSFFLYLFFWSYIILDKNYLRYFILIPLLFLFFDLSYIKKIKIINFFIIPLFLILHYLLTNFLNQNSIGINDILSIVFLTLIIFCFINYRDLILNNFDNILKIYFISLIFFSILNNQNINVGSCGSVFLENFTLLKNLSISKAFFSENSHLAMMNIAAISSGLFSYSKNQDKSLLFLVILALIINVFNLSTTFVLGFILCSVILILKSKNTFFNFSIIIISLSLIIFYIFSDNCNKKFKNIKISDVINENIKRKKTGDLTSTIYERSMIISIDTLKNHPLGWGYNGSIKATSNFFDKNKNKIEYKLEDNTLNTPLLGESNIKIVDNYVWKLNLKDALGNVFKLVIEFGYLSFFLILLFCNYFFKKNFNKFDFFVVSIFVVQLFRGAGFINGGFIIAFTEIFLIQYLIKDSHHQDKKSQN